MFYSQFLAKALDIFLFPPLHATCPHHVSVTLSGVSLQADHGRLIPAVARVSGRPHYIYRQLCRVSAVLLFDYPQSQGVAQVRTTRPDTTKPHTSLRQVNHPVLVLTPVHASVRSPYCSRQQRYLLAQVSVTYRHCGRVCSLWQDPLTECTLLQVFLHSTVRAVRRTQSPCSDRRLRPLCSAQPRSF
jgi:hypothetical protein